MLTEVARRLTNRWSRLPPVHLYHSESLEGGSLNVDLISDAFPFGHLWYDAAAKLGIVDCIAGRIRPFAPQLPDWQRIAD